MYVPNGLHWNNPTGEEILHQLRLVVYPITSFIHPRWLFGISSINYSYRHPNHRPQKWVLPKMVLDGCKKSTTSDSKWPFYPLAWGHLRPLAFLDQLLCRTAQTPRHFLFHSDFRSGFPVALRAADLENFRYLYGIPRPSKPFKNKVFGTKPRVLQNFKENIGFCS